MNIKFLTIVAITFISSVCFSMEVNKQALGESGSSFVQSIDDQISGYVRALRRGSEVEFDALKLSMFMNQTANIEKKLDILISETRKNNRLLAQQTKSSNKLIEAINKAAELPKKSSNNQG